MTNIYILKLKNKKYYIGKTENPKLRVGEHFSGDGSAWTRKYPPKKIKKIINNCDDYDEDKYTKKYMAKYGINNVRGGSYININLEDYQLQALKRELIMTNNLCARCGRDGHFAKDCYAKTDADGNYIEEEEEEEEEEMYQCEYCDKIFDTLKGCTFHENVHCKKKHKKTIKTKTNEHYNKSYKSNIVCYRCGRDGHYSTKCYAKYDIEGDYIDD